MRFVSSLASIILLGFAAASAAQGTPDISGKWETTYGPLVFTLSDIKDSNGVVIGKAATAPYKSEGGTVSGELKGSTLVGHWHEPHSSMQCATARSGTRYWGRVEFAFNPTTDEYAGKWGYCEEAPERGWSGKKG